AKEANLAQLSRQLDVRAAGLESTSSQFQDREDRLLIQTERLKATGRRLGQARKAFRSERFRWEAQQADDVRMNAGARADLEATRHEALALVQQLPDLDLRAQSAAERLARSRAELREHLGELHSYAEQSQEDIEALRAQVLLEAEQVQAQRLLVHKAREEHRLAVAAFRQQLIEWQGQVAEMKGSLAHGETRLERRQAQVEEHARRINATSIRLTEQAEQLQEQERMVAESRKEMERHLSDMREWY